MSEIFTEQLMAVANVTLTAFAIVTAVLAGLAFRKQSREVKDQADLLKVQSDQLELQRRQFDQDQAERRRAQAAQVFIMIERVESRDGVLTMTATASNTSPLPVYDLWVQWRSRSGDFGIPNVDPQFPPGSTKAFNGAWTDHARLSGLSVSLDFRDAIGVRWRTTERGILTELCGEISLAPARTHCMFVPAHDGPHSWDLAAASH